MLLSRGNVYNLFFSLSLSLFSSFVLAGRLWSAHFDLAMFHKRTIAAVTYTRTHRANSSLCDKKTHIICYVLCSLLGICLFYITYAFIWTTVVFAYDLLRALYLCFSWHKRHSQTICAIENGVGSVAAFQHNRYIHFIWFDICYSSTNFGMPERRLIRKVVKNNKN